MSPRWRGLLREPLLHCLLIAALLYALHGLWGRPEEDASTIVVDREALLRQMQYRVRNFNPLEADAAYDRLSDSQREQLVNEYLEDEALYREARRLGLAEGDEVIRQRLVQKMGYLLEDENRPTAPPTEAQLRQYLEAHRDLYEEPATLTFTHVFFDAAERGDAAARDAAARAVVQLQARGAGFNEALALGDRFAFHTHYVERTTDYIASQLGEAFPAALDGLPLERWQGPLKSREGWHAVLVARRQSARTPDWQSLRGRLAEDWQLEQVAAARAVAVRRLLSRYELDMQLQ